MHRLVIRFTSRSLEIHLEDEGAEHDEVQYEVYSDDRKQHQPVGFCLAGQDAVENEVDQTVGEGRADCDLQEMADREGKTCEPYVDREQHRSEEQECELDRLGDTGDEGCQRNREQQGACLFLLLRSRAGVHGQSSARETAHHERIFADQEAGRVNREFRGVRGSEFREENVLRAFHKNAVDHHGAADTCLPERHVEDVVQTERDERTLDAAVNECPEVSCRLDNAAQCVDAALDDRPYHEHQRADDDAADHADDGHETRSGEEGKRVGQLHFIEVVAENTCQDTG